MTLRKDEVISVRAYYMRQYSPCGLGRYGLALAGLSLLWLIAICNGSFGTMDTQLRLRMAHAWHTHEPEVAPLLPKPTSREQIEYGVQGAGDKRYIFYDPGQSLLMLPMDALAPSISRLVHPSDYKSLREALAAWFVFLPLNLALVLAAFWLLREFGIEDSLAALTSLLWLTATTVLPYAQVAFQNNQVLLFILLAHGAILTWTRSRRPLPLVASGAAAAATFLIRATSAIHVLTIGLFLLGCLALLKARPRQALGAVGAWLCGALPLVLGGRLFDYIRYGSFFTTGQSAWTRQVNTDPVFAGLPPLAAHFPFTHPAHVGLLGALFSPAKSLFIYDPLLLPCLVVGIFAWGRLSPLLRCFALLALLNLILHLALTARLDFWHGDGAWGARYHVSSVALLLLVLLPFAVKEMLRPGRVAAWVLRAAVLCGIIVQILAIAMPFNAEFSLETLQDPRYCVQATWNSPLGFRLGERFENLYCLLAHSASARCPQAIAAQDHPPAGECRETREDLLAANRLAFFPFDPTRQLFRGLLGGCIWIVAALGALAGTGAWLYHACRTGSARLPEAPRTLTRPPGFDGDSEPASPGG